MRSIRTECPAHLLALPRGHLESVVNKYPRHYNQARLHRSPGSPEPIPRPAVRATSGTPGCIRLPPAGPQFGADAGNGEYLDSSGSHRARVKAVR